MKREDVKKLLENGVLQAFAEGKTIQVFSETSQEWCDCGDVYNPALHTMYYRVKPEPLHDWVIELDGLNAKIYYAKTAAEIKQISGWHHYAPYRQLVPVTEE